LILASAATAQPDCSYDAATLLALPFDQFDQDLAAGWRALQNKGCLAAAAEVLRRYRDEHRPLSRGQRSSLAWHEGQVLALMGSSKAAIPLLLAGVPTQDALGFADYASGTVAFLERDKSKLIAARARLAAMPKPADWADKITLMAGGKRMSFLTPWPPSLNVLDGLIRCFDQPYKQAYSCGPLKQVGATALSTPAHSYNPGSPDLIPKR
jgi:hypothetical protein